VINLIYCKIVYLNFLDYAIGKFLETDLNLMDGNCLGVCSQEIGGN